ncbi:MAG: hypothetical protein V1779_09925 [bacterium]
MEILIAIMWFLQILIPGQTYTLSDIEALSVQNQVVIETIQNDQILSQDAVNYYDQTFSTGNVDIIEEWDENPIPIKR